MSMNIFNILEAMKHIFDHFRLIIIIAFILALSQYHTVLLCDSKIYLKKWKI